MALNLYSLKFMELAPTPTVTGGEVTGFEKWNALDFNPDTYWKGDGITDLYDWDFDFAAGAGATGVIGCFAFLKNYTSSWAAGFMRLRYWNGAWNDLASISLHDTSTPIRLLDSGSGSIFDKWSIQFDDLTGSDPDPHVAMLGFYQKHTITRSSQYPLNDAIRHRNILSKSVGGRNFSRLINKNETKIFTRSFKFSGTSDWNALLAAHTNSRGTHYPLIYQDGTDDPILVRFLQDRIPENQTDHEYYNPTVIFEQLPFIADGETY